MKALRRGSVLAVLWLVLMPLLRAEDASRHSSSTAYVYFAPSGTGTHFSEVLGIGGGGEACSTRGSGLVATSVTFFLAEISEQVLASPR